MPIQKLPTINKPITSWSVIILTVFVLTACSEHDSHAHSDDHSKAAETSAVKEPANLDEEHESHEEHDEAAHVSSAQRSADSHAHGDAELAIALDGQKLSIELDSPLYNLVGFEHQPKNAEEQQQLNVAQQQLNQSEELFEFNPEAGCKAKPGKDISLDLAKDHADKDDSEHADNSEHSDVLLSYEYSCDQPAALSTVTVKLFEFFDYLEELELVFLGPATQLQTNLNTSNNRANLKR